MNDVLPVARDAVRTLWRHKRLWVLGLFVAAGAGGGTRFDAPSDATGITAGWVAGLVLIAAVTGVITLALHVISEGALIDAVREERRGRVPALGPAWRRGLASAGSVLGIKALTWVATSAVVAAAAAPLLLGLLEIVPLALGVALTVPLVVVAVPTALSLYLAHEIGLRMVVLEQRRAVDALRAGLRFLRGRLRFALTLLVVDGVAQLVTAVIAVPFVLVVLAIGGATYAVAGLVPAVVVGAIVLAPIALALTGARGTFRSALWTHGMLDGRPGAA